MNCNATVEDPNMQQIQILGQSRIIIHKTGNRSKHINQRDHRVEKHREIWETGQEVKPKHRPPEGEHSERQCDTY